MSVNFGGGAGGGTTVTINVVNSGAIIYISGQCVCISGQPVTISGNVVSANISGQTVYPVSGQEFLFIWDYSGQTWTKAATATSGSNKLLVDAGAINVASNISGQAVFLGSGSVLGLSGLPVTTSISGNVVSTSVTTNISGQAVFLGSGSSLGASGLAVLTSVSGNAVSTSISGNVVAVSGTVTVAGAVTTSTSGNYTNFSGQAVSVSGNAVSTSISGNVVSISGSVTTITSVSGNVVNVSGAMVTVSGLTFTTSYESGLGAVSGVMGPAGLMAWDLSGLKWNPLSTGNSGTNDLRIAGTINAAANISGQAVFLGSGSVLGLSGLPVSVSGNTVAVSGLTFTTAYESGLGAVSGVMGPAGLMVWDLSGLNWNPVAAGNSGTNDLRIAGTINAASNISGQVVQFASGGNTVTLASGAVVLISGQTVIATANANISGQAVFLGSGSVLGLSGLPVSTSISGNVVSISGTVATTTSISGNVVSVSGLWTSTTLQSGQTGVSGGTGVLTFAYDYSGLNWVPIPVANSGVRIPIFTNSGNALTTSVSGNVVAISGSVTTITSISGNNVNIISGSVAGFSGLAVSISGNVVAVSGTVTIAGAVTTSVSGNYVSIISGSVAGFSGLAVSHSGNVIAISGSVTTITSISGNTVNVSGALSIGNSILLHTASGAGMMSANSGGVQGFFSGGPLISVTLRNNSGNGPMYIGGASGTTTPFIGTGIELYANETFTIAVANFNQIRAVTSAAGTSGQIIRYWGVMQ